LRLTRAGAPAPKDFGVAGTGVPGPRPDWPMPASPRVDSAMNDMNMKTAQKSFRRRATRYSAASPLRSNTKLQRTKPPPPPFGLRHGKPAFAGGLPPSLASFRLRLPATPRQDGGTSRRGEPDRIQMRKLPTHILGCSHELYRPIANRAGAHRQRAGDPVRQAREVAARGERRGAGDDGRSPGIAPNRSFECGWEGWGRLGKLCEGYAQRRGRRELRENRKGGRAKGSAEWGLGTGLQALRIFPGPAVWQMPLAWGVGIG
jgi:hypothetical protein